MIGQFKGQQDGPLVIAFGATHGNEPAGVQAIAEVFRMLEAEKHANPGFEFIGQFTGIIGNYSAFQSGQRFIEKDLNRIWDPAYVEDLLRLPTDTLANEDLELVQLLHCIRATIAAANARRLFILDLHTTSADGGIFSIPLEDDKKSIDLAAALHAPVVMGLLKGLSGTLMHYAFGNHFAINGLPEQTCCVAFESGQHNDPLSVSRSVSAIISTLRAVGCISPEDVDHRHDDILLEYAADLPKVTRIIHVHHIAPDEHFSMRPGYVNFQPVHKGEYLADSSQGQVLAPVGGLILMPLYQLKGADGFFIVKDLKA
jgi:succinylglutamate desuccinylase